MNIAVFGATGGTGQEVVKQALAQGHHVTAFLRDPFRIPVTDRRLRLVVADVLDAQCVSEAIANQHAVVVALGSHGKKDLNVRSAGMANIIRAMEQHHVRRLVVLRAGGVGDSYRESPFILKALIRTMLKQMYADHEKQEQLVRASQLDWVIVRPAMLTNGPDTGRFENQTINSKLPKNKVARADVAAFLIQLTENDCLREVISIP